MTSAPPLSTMEPMPPRIPKAIIANPPRKTPPPRNKVLGYEFTRFLTIQEMRDLRKLSYDYEAWLKPLLRCSRRVLYGSGRKRGTR